MKDCFVWKIKRETIINIRNMKSEKENIEMKQENLKESVDSPIKTDVSAHSDETLTSSRDQDNQDAKRGSWGSKVEFVLACIGMSVGFGNIWRFPYLAYANGGGAFLLAYFVVMMLVGRPMYFLELAVGQYCTQGPITVWRLCPLAKGVGWGMVVMSLIVCLYYNVLIAYTIFFLVCSFMDPIPWSDCFDWWGADERCYVRRGRLENMTCLTLGNCSCTELLQETRNESLIIPDINCLNITMQSATEQFWRRYVLGLDFADGLNDIGPIRWQLALCLLLTWVLIFFCLFKGIEVAGKVVYFTATFPYFVLLILFIRGVTLDNADVGIKWFFIPKWEMLLSVEVWKNAAQQMFFSLGLSWGTLFAFSSYSKFTNRVHLDAFFISWVDCFTSVGAGIVIFSVLGSMAVELNVPIEQVVAGGQGLAFVAYPEALARLPVVPQLWSVLFFLMMFTIGLDSQFATVETVLTAIYDEWPELRKYKSVCVAVICVVCFLLGLPCTCNGGQYVLDLMDTFGAGICSLFIATFEMITLMWIYGFHRIKDDIFFMLGIETGWIFWISWVLICPLALGFLFIISCVQFSPARYGDYQYPDWAQGIGWLLTLMSIQPIFVWGIYQAVKYYRQGRLRDVIKPTSEWGPGLPHARKQLEQLKGCGKRKKYDPKVDTVAPESEVEESLESDQKSGFLNKISALFARL